jgi:hypothetical protein
MKRIKALLKAIVADLLESAAMSSRSETVPAIA